jgi:hypothetical protein
MKKISFVVGKDYQNNRIFDLNNEALNRDDCLLPFFLLKERLKKNGFEMMTQDLLSPEEANLVIYNEMPKPFPNVINIEKSFLLLFESELIRPDNWNTNYHSYFKKIFTWHDQFVNNQKYIKFNFPNKITTTQVESLKRKKLVTLISGNKTCSHPNELYSHRLETIRWFEKNAPEDFDYYGIGWDYQISLWWQKVFRKLGVLSWIPKNPSKCYLGKVKSKQATLKEYQFSICYENGKDIDGYITEKIIDCFVAGNIPIYWGPKNIAQHIPANTYINKTDFKSHEELLTHLKDMSLEKIQDYQRNIKDFLESDRGYAFSNECFVDIIAKEILSE